MADTKAELSSIPAPYISSSFKALLANLPLFLDHLNSQAKPSLFPALCEWAVKKLIIMEFHKRI